MRKIRKGEEITIDYSLSESYPIWRMQCRCGSKQCRKLITPYDDLSWQYKKKMAKYTSKYLIDLKLHLTWEEYLAMLEREKQKNNHLQ